MELRVLDFLGNLIGSLKNCPSFLGCLHMRYLVKLIRGTLQNIALMALLFALANARAALSHSDLAVMGLTYPFSTESHKDSSIAHKKALIRTFQKA